MKEKGEALPHHTPTSRHVCVIEFIKTHHGDPPLNSSPGSSPTMLSNNSPNNFMMSSGKSAPMNIGKPAPLTRAAACHANFNRLLSHHHPHLYVYNRIYVSLPQPPPRAIHAIAPPTRLLTCPPASTTGWRMRRPLLR